MLISDEGQPGSVAWARQDVHDASRESAGGSSMEHLAFSSIPAATEWGWLGEGVKGLNWVLCFLLT